jgi:hypothetical protein
MAMSDTEYPPAVIAAADQMAAAYNDMIVNFPKLTVTLEATFDKDAYQRLVDALPMQVDIVGGPLDGMQVTFAPDNPGPETLVVQVGQVQHWHRRVVCDWWTCYEWVRDFDGM